MSTPTTNRENNQVSTFHAALLASALLTAGLSISADVPNDIKQPPRPVKRELRLPSFDPYGPYKRGQRWEDCPGRRTITGYCLPEGSLIYD